MGKKRFALFHSRKGDFLNGAICCKFIYGSNLSENLVTFLFNGKWLNFLCLSEENP